LPFLLRLGLLRGRFKVLDYVLRAMSCYSIHTKCMNAQPRAEVASGVGVVCELYSLLYACTGKSRVAFLRTMYHAYLRILVLDILMIYEKLQNPVLCGFLCPSAIASYIWPSIHPSTVFSFVGVHCHQCDKRPSLRPTAHILFLPASLMVLCVERGEQTILIFFTDSTPLCYFTSVFIQLNPPYTTHTIII
jgi:hypothetical protein